MSRAYIVYFCVAAICISGLSLILTYGQKILAPPDLSGRWRVKWDAPPSFSSKNSTMTVAQSGRFIQVSFENSSSLNLKLAEPFGDGEQKNPTLKLVGNIWTMTLTGNPKLGDVRIALTGPTRHSGTAEKIIATTRPSKTTNGNAH